MGRIKPQALLLQSKKKKGPSRISVSTIVLCNLIIVVLMFSLVAIYRQRAKGARNQSSSGSDTKGIKIIEDSVHITIPNQAILNTTKGTITLQLFGKSSAHTVAKFVERSQRGYFNGLPFHRVIKHFLIQGGDPKFAGTREEWTVGGQLNGQLEFNPKHEAFMLATSKPENQGEGFDLFITTAPIPDLNDKLTVFGRVIKGEDVVQEIEEVDTDEHFRPKSPIIINDIILKDEL